MEFKNLIRILPPHYLKKMEECEQDPVWHPEGNVLIHTRIVFNRVKKNHPDDIDMQIAAIFHDTGKIFTCKKHKNSNDITRISHHDHEKHSVDFFERWYFLFRDLIKDYDKVLTIVKEHMQAKRYVTGEMTKEKKRKKMEANPYFKNLLEFVEYDTMVDENGNETFSKTDILI